MKLKLVSLVDSIEDAGQRAAALVSRLMVFSHKENRQIRTIDLQESVRNLLDMIRQLIGEDIALKFQSFGSQLPVDVDPGEIEQIVFKSLH